MTIDQGQLGAQLNPEAKEQTGPQHSEVAELLMPTNLPEASFQAYEELVNNGQRIKPQFLGAAWINPELTYPRLRDTSRLDYGIERLQHTIDLIRGVEADQNKADIIAGTLEFRIAEMYYVKKLGALSVATATKRPESEVSKLADDARSLGEELYGAPEDELVDASFSEIWRQIDNKRLTATGQKIYDQLESGFYWGGRFFPGLPRPDGSAELPNLMDESLDWAGEIILEANADIKDMVDEFWDNKQAEHGPDYEADPQDITQAFQQALVLLDPDKASGVQIIYDPNASALSFDTSQLAVKVGANRPPIETKNLLFQRIIHELGVHGGRTMSGLQTDLPVLGTGLYTKTERPDYLTFEEGFASTIEEAISDDPSEDWSGNRVGHYANLGLVKAGADFRAVFETAWRYTLLMYLEDYQEPTAESIRKYQELAYINTIRIFRGTPTTIQEAYPDIAPLSFNKDLAYLKGCVLAMDNISELHSKKDKASLLKLFKAKYDPTIPEQAAIVDRYLA